MGYVEKVKEHKRQKGLKTVHLCRVGRHVLENAERYETYATYS